MNLFHIYSETKNDSLKKRNKIIIGFNCSIEESDVPWFSKNDNNIQPKYGFISPDIYLGYIVKKKGIFSFNIGYRKIFTSDLEQLNYHTTDFNSYSDYMSTSVEFFLIPTVEKKISTFIGIGLIVHWLFQNKETDFSIFPSEEKFDYGGFNTKSILLGPKFSLGISFRIHNKLSTQFKLYSSSNYSLSKDLFGTCFSTYSLSMGLFYVL